LFFCFSALPLWNMYINTHVMYECNSMQR
jgi:hypothetical protein